jgi:uncharacterized membrane protein YfcA
VLTALLGALAIGLSLGLLGSGGSILTVPVLHYLLGQPEQAAIGGSLLVVGLIAASAAIPYARSRQIAWRNVLAFGLPGVLGALLGATVARWVPGVAQILLFALVMFVAAWKMVAGRPLHAADEARETHRVAVMAGGLGVGALSGVVGVGGGFLIVPALVLLAGVPLAQAVGTSLVVISLNALAGFARYQGVLEAKGIELDYPTLLAIAAIGVLGSLAGHRLGRRLPQATLRRVFGTALLLLAGAITLDVLRRLAW